MPDPGLLGRFLDEVGALDADAALGLVREAADRHGIEATVTQVLAAAQQEVGRRWEFGDWTVAQEHAATAIVDDGLGLLRAASAPPGTGPVMALVCAEGEWHVTPARMAALRFQQRGWRVVVLGASTPAPHLARTLEEVRPDIVGVSCTLPLHLPGARRTIEVAHRMGLHVVVGGAAFDAAGRRARAVGADAAGVDLDEVAATARSWLDRAVELRSPEAGHADEVARLRGSADAIVAAAYGDLLARLPGLASASDTQLARTAEDLWYIVEFLGVALDMDDASVLVEFLGWLGGLLAVRGVPHRALVAGVEAIGDQLGDHLPSARALLLQEGRRAA